MTARPEDQLTGYLSDVHALEQQALAQLRSAPDMAGDPRLAAAFREHYEQLVRVADRADDAETASVGRAILSEERAAARALADCWDEALTAALVAA